MFSRLPVWTGSDAELPSDRLPLLISFSQGVLLTEDTDKQVNLSVVQSTLSQSTNSVFSSRILTDNLQC